MTTTVYSSGNFEDTVVNAGQTIVIGSNAVATTDGVASGGVLIIMSGATDTETTISSGGFEYLSGGTAMQDGALNVIEGTQVVLSNGSAVGTELGSGGQIEVSAGGEAANALVSAGGTITVSGDGEASNDSIILGGVEIVNSGGLAFGESVNAGGILTVSSGSADGTALFGGTLVVSRGGLVGTTIISSGGLEAVDAGGTTDTDYVSSGGTQSVTSNGVATFAQVYSGGSQTVISGGTANETVLSGGSLVVSAGGFAAVPQISSGGSVSVLAGGTITGAAIYTGGSLDIQAGAVASGGFSFVGSGGVVEIDGPVIPAVTIFGFVAGDTIELPGIAHSAVSTPTLGADNVLSFSDGVVSYTLPFDPLQGFAGEVFQLALDGAGTAIEVTAGNLGGPVVTSGKTLTISGVTSSLVTVNNGGTVLVSSGGTLSASLVNNGGTVRVDPGGAASGLSVAPGGLAVNFGSMTEVTVDPGATDNNIGAATSSIVDGGNFYEDSGASDTIVYNGGLELIDQGVDNNTTVNAGGYQDLELNASAVDTIFNSGGSGLVRGPGEEENASAISTIVNNGGTETVNGTADFITVNSGGTEIVNADGTTSNTVIDGGLLDMPVEAGLNIFPVAAGPLDFGPGDGTLAIATLRGMSAVISGFGPGDVIDLTSVTPGSAPSAGVDPANDMLIVSAGGTTEMFQFAGDYTSAKFDVTGDSGSGTLVTELPCYAAGTRIATARGEIPVEALAPGDEVLTHAGRLLPVRWVGHRRVDCGRHPSPEKVSPVRVRVGAFAAGRPHRDLFLSPDHAVFIDGDGEATAPGVLIPVRYLVNGASIVRHAAASVSYWHVELERHDLLLAEGLACESYLDTGNRSAFVNGGDAVAMHPEFARGVWQTRGCAALVVEGPRLAAARRGMLARAELLGHRLTREPELAVFADGHELPMSTEGSTWHVRIPATARRIALCSRTWVPSETRPDEDDARSLGVALTGIRLDGRLIGLDDPRLSSGWHLPEPGWRWTDGNAGLALAGVRLLSFTVVLTGTYWGKPRRGIDLCGGIDADCPQPLNAIWKNPA